MDVAAGEKGGLLAGHRTLQNRGDAELQSLSADFVDGIQKSDRSFIANVSLICLLREENDRSPGNKFWECFLRYS